MSAPSTAPVVLIPLARLREPELMARDAIDPEGIAELTHSIRQLGLIQPITVKPAGDDVWEVVAGHRRLLACQEAPLDPVPCRVEGNAAIAEAVKFAENFFRRDLSPVEEAHYLQKLYELNGEDIERVVAVVKRPRTWISGRLNLLRGDEAVLAALRDGKINLTIAECFNRIKDKSRRLYYLSWAVTTGCTAEQARSYEQTANTMSALSEAAGAKDQTQLVADALAAPAPQVESQWMPGAQPWQFTSSEETRPCLFCEAPWSAWKMLLVAVCPHCTANILRKLRERQEPPLADLLLAWIEESEKQHGSKGGAVS